MLPSWLNVAGVSLLLPMVRKKRDRRLKTSCSVVSTRFDCVADVSTSVRLDALHEDVDDAGVASVDGADEDGPLRVETSLASRSSRIALSLETAGECRCQHEDPLDPHICDPFSPCLMTAWYRVWTS